MHFFRHRPLAKQVKFDEENMSVELQDGRKIVVPLVYFPRLFQASQQERRECVISGGGIGLHWEALDEDILVQNLLLGAVDTDQPFYKSA